MKLASLAIFFISVAVVGCSESPSKKSTITPVAPATTNAAPNDQTDAPTNAAPSVDQTAVSEPKPDAAASVKAEQSASGEAAPSSDASPAGGAATSSASNAGGQPSDVDAAGLAPLDLSNFYRIHMDSFDGLGRGTWRISPKNSVTVGNIPLKVGGIFVTWGAGNAGRGIDYPTYIEGIPVGKKFDSLYLYSCTFHSSPDGTPVASVIFNYDDEETAAMEILYGNHVRDWWKKPHESDEILDPKSKKVFRGLFPDAVPGQPDHIQFFLTEIVNPHPEKRVLTLDFVSAKEESALCVMALTTGPKEMLKIDPNQIEVTAKDGGEEDQKKP